ncbi:unnamed protein product [Fusarium fujikuroi]|nr:unnamed protein product [Fusarium fujikuroi]
MSKDEVRHRRESANIINRYRWMIKPTAGPTKGQPAIVARYDTSELRDTTLEMIHVQDVFEPRLDPGSLTRTATRVWLEDKEGGYWSNFRGGLGESASFHVFISII